MIRHLLKYELDIVCVGHGLRIDSGELRVDAGKAEGCSNSLSMLGAHGSGNDSATLVPISTLALRCRIVK